MPPRIFSEAGHLLGRTLAGIVHTLDPEIVIVLGEGTVAWKHWSFGFEPALRSALMPSRRGLASPSRPGRTRAGRRARRRSCSRPRSTPTDVAGDQGRLVRARLVEQSTPQGDAG